MPPQIKQAKLETLEAIIKEVEGRFKLLGDELSHRAKQPGGVPTPFADGITVGQTALLELKSTLQAEKELIEKEK